MGRIFKRGENYYADFWTQDGQRIKVSLRTKDRKVATARLRTAELGTSGDPAQAPKALGHAVDEMISLKRDATAKSYKHKANHLFRVIGADVDINTLTRATVAEYASKRLKEGAHRHTIHKELVVLRQALKEARERDEYAGTLEIVPKWKAEYEPRRRALSEDEFAKLMDAVQPERHTWLMLQAYTGAELSAMKGLVALPRGGWEKVDLRHGTIAIPGTKNSSRHRQAVPLHEELKRWLKRLDPKAPLVAKWGAVAAHLRKACKAAGIEPATTHDLRRTFGSWLVQNGVDILHVSRLMGNSPAMVARVYGQTTDRSYAEAIKRLPAMKRRPARVPPTRTPAKRKRTDET